MTQVILGKSRVRETCMPGSVRAKAEWLSYSTIPVDDFFAEYPHAPGRLDKVDTVEADEVIEAIDATRT
jgi:hypothetical protein